MGESARYLATNQILLKLWPLLLEEAEGMERKIKSTGENKESVLKQAFDEWKKDLPQYSEEPFCRKSAWSERKLRMFFGMEEN